MSGGPYDKSGNGLANWLSLSGATSTSRYAAFLHKQDFFGSALEIEVVRALIEDNTSEVVQVDNETNVLGAAQIYMTNEDSADPHNSLATPEYEGVWRALLQRF